jgi:hypothetical protein
MPSRSGFILLVCLGFTGAAITAEGPPAPTPVAVERLIEQLGDRKSAVREKAGAALEALGPAALPRLREAKDHTDPEVRRRVESLLVALEKANLLLPKRVSLKISQRPIREAVTDLARQTGYPVDLYPNAQNNDEREKQLHTLHVDQQPFWEALDKLCREGGLALQRTYGEDARLHLRFSDEYSPYVHHAGAFRLVAQGFQYHRSIEFGALSRQALTEGQRSEQLTFRFTIMVEPRMPLLWLGPIVLTEAVDERNNSMLPAEESTQEEDRRAYSDRGFYQDAWVNLVRVSRDARSVKRVRGFAPLRVLVEQSPELVVDKILAAKGQKQKSENCELEIEDIKHEAAGGNRCEIKFNLRNLRGEGTTDYNFYNSVRHRFELRDAKGVKYTWSGGGWGGNDNNVRGSFTFTHPGGEAGPPAKLIFYGWTTLYHRVPFEFRDLPLP